MTSSFLSSASSPIISAASSVARFFLNEKILSKKVLTYVNKNNLITSLKFLIRYKSKTYSGYFKFGGIYKNELNIYEKDNILTLGRVFSPPSNQVLKLTVRSKKKIINYNINKDDCFGNFFTDVCKRIKKRDYYFFINQMKFDNNFRNKILKEK